MRIKKIEVNKLFGMFNHTIHVNVEERITIIHGPNGIGKTVLLSMLYSIFRNQYNIFKKVPFEAFKILFENESVLTIRKEFKFSDPNLEQPKQREEIYLEFMNPVDSLKTHTISYPENYAIDFPLEMIEDLIPGLRRVGASSWVLENQNEILTLTDIIDQYSDHLPIPERKKRKDPTWLTELINSVSIHFIETQRLLSYRKGRRRIGFERDTSMIPAVLNYSDEIVVSIQEILAEYGTLSQKLDRTFPTRLVTGSYQSPKKNEDLKNELNSLELKRNQLVNAGLLDKEQEIEFKDLLISVDKNQNVLSVYIEDVKQKLSVFDELTRKIDLFVKIVNSRFLYKKILVNKKDGFIFVGLNNKRVPATSLSSGEQHELVLFYELLFKVKAGSIILVDEPELSLHVVWQQKFIEDMQEIIKLSKFDLILATHSPSIIQDRWDLTVELTGPEDETISNT